jgi:hypothetical protein
MLEEIGRVALAIGREMADGAASIPLEVAAGDQSGLLTGRERLAFLADAMPQIERALRAIAANPRAEIRGQVTEMPPEKAKRPLPTARNRAILRGLAKSSSAPLMTVRGQTLTTDIPENRFLLRLIERWCHDLRAIRIQAAREGAENVRVQSLELEGRLRRMTQFLADLQAESAHETSSLPALTAARINFPSPALMMDARYRILYELYRRYRRLLRYEWETPFLRLPAREEWRLYEIWCFFQTASALRSLGFRARQGDAVMLSYDRLTIRLEKGRESRLLFSAPATRETVTLFYNRAYPGAKAASSGIHSRTHAMIPDITLEWRERLLLLDPKFRSYWESGTEQEDIHKIQVTDNAAPLQAKALSDDVGKMHAYRDALVKDEQPVVEQAWCLFPGIAEGGTQIIAYPTSTPDEPFGSAGIGAIRLRPGQSDEALRKLIAAWTIQ